MPDTVYTIAEMLCCVLSSYQLISGGMHIVSIAFEYCLMPLIIEVIFYLVTSGISDLYEAITAYYLHDTRLWRNAQLYSTGTPCTAIQLHDWPMQL